jgi:hypothetical protein
MVKRRVEFQAGISAPGMDSDSPARRVLGQCGRRGRGFRTHWGPTSSSPWVYGQLFPRQHLWPRICQPAEQIRSGIAGRLSFRGIVCAVGASIRLRAFRAGELREPVEAHLGVGARNANGQAWRIGLQRILVRKLVVHRLRRKEPRYRGFERWYQWFHLCGGRRCRCGCRSGGCGDSRLRGRWRGCCCWACVVTRSSGMRSD